MLNFQYEQFLQKKLSILVAYSEMVERNPYRVLASYSYDFGEKSLRSDRVADLPYQKDELSDVESNMESRAVSLPSYFSDISQIPEHNDFIQILINAKVAATCSAMDINVCWRGYTTTVSQNMEMTTEALKNKLLTALQNVNDLRDEERQVIKT